MFVYCGNNPIARADSVGYAWYGTNTVYINDGGSGKSTAELSTWRELEETNEEYEVLKNGWFSVYKGVPVIRAPIGKGGFSFGIILLGDELVADEYGVQTLRHEYGHTRQLEEMGLVKYTAFVVMPSLTGATLSRLNALDFDYYSLPWEYEANIKAGVQREGGYVPRVEQLYYAYRIIIDYLCGDDYSQYAAYMDS